MLSMLVPRTFSFSRVNVVRSLVSFLKGLLHAVFITAVAVRCWASEEFLPTSLA